MSEKMKANKLINTKHMTVGCVPHFNQQFLLIVKDLHPQIKAHPYAKKIYY